MKKIIYFSFGLLLFGLSLLAQTPQAFKYQAIARDNAGNLIANQNVSFRISILQGSAGGTCVYTETHALKTNDFGLANLNVGGGVPVSGNFSTIGWGSNTYFLKIEMDPLGGSAYQLMGTSQLLSVPYALYARNSSDGVGNGTSGQTLMHNGTAWIGNSNLYNNGTNIGIGTLSPASKLHVFTPSFSAKLGTTSQGVYGEHSVSGSYGWLGASNEGGYGFSPNGYGMRGQTTNGYAFYGEHSASGNSGWIGSSNEGLYGNSIGGFGVKGNTANGYAIYGTATGTGFAGYFSGKAFVSGNMGIGESVPNRRLYVSDLQAGLSYPLKLENKYTIENEAAVGILFSAGGSGTNDRGKGALAYQYTSTWNRGSFHFLQNAETNANNPTLANAVMTITNSGNVGMGTTNPQAKLEVAANAGPHIIINDLNGSNDRPGIKFSNNYIHYIAGDDLTDEYFGFYSGFGDNRTYDAILAVYGKATSNWGKYLGLSHNGTSGRIFTDAGDLLLEPAGGVAINTTSAGAYKLNVSGDVYFSGTIKTSIKTESIIIPPAAFTCDFNDRGYYNGGEVIMTNDLLINVNGFEAPVYLPHNATVVKVTSYWQDNSTNSGTLLFSRTKLTDGSDNTLSANYTYWQSTVRNYLTDTTIETPVIDNNNYMYYLGLLLYNDILFYGAKIEYTYDEIK
ncbi:MAG: hypothetical protein JW731_11215 [Bacteroidales bacterium]|nr:hypothetical protein [Bacteroidales bacterium]